MKTVLFSKTDKIKVVFPVCCRASANHTGKNAMYEKRLQSLFYFLYDILKQENLQAFTALFIFVYKRMRQNEERKQ